MAALTRYIIRRLIHGVITLLIVTVIVFMLFEGLPGDPLTRFTQDPNIPESVKEQLKVNFGLNDPPHIRLGKFIRNMFTFEFGISILEGRPVSAVIADALPKTIFLFVSATVLTYVFGILIGSFIAWRRGRVSEGAVVVSSLFFNNMPSFWIGLILLWLFAFTWRVFDLGGWSDPIWTVEHFPFLADRGPGDPLFVVIDIGSHSLLPMVALVLISAAGAILLMQTSMLEVMGEDFVLTARAKGLAERIVRRRHVARNAYLPVVTSFTISIAFSIGGAIVLEQVYSYFGVGYYFLAALRNQDQFLAGAILFIISFLVIAGNIIADILYGVLDPRVRI